MIVFAAIAAWGPAVVIVVAVAWGRAAVAVTFEEAAPTGRAIAITAETIARRSGMSAGFTPFVIVAIAIAGWTIGATEAAARAIAIAKSRTIGTHIAFDKAAFEPSFEVTLKMAARRAIGARATIGGHARTSWRRRWHVFVDEVGQGHELFFAQLAVAVFIELREQLFGLGHFGRAIVMAVWTVTISIVSVAIMAISITPIFMPAVLTAFAIVTSLTMAFAHELAHFLTGFLAFVVAELAVAIFIELFDDFLPHFAAGGTVVAFLGVAAI
jgi:hypothetical protein